MHHRVRSPRRLALLATRLLPVPELTACGQCSILVVDNLIPTPSIAGTSDSVARYCEPGRRDFSDERSLIMRNLIRSIRAVGVVLLFLAVPLGVVSPVSGAVAHSITVRGNHLVNATGHVTRLIGVDRSGTEYACEQGWGIFDGPNTASSVAAMKSWHINAVRLPLNEGCWLDLYTLANDGSDQGRNPAPFEGTAYRSAIEDYVALLHRADIAVILDLHALDAPGGLDVAPMADAAHSVTFWKSVARTFKNDHGVLFDVYNEPHGISWACWLHGCTTTVSGVAYQTAGMQSLVDAVRSSGASQPIMLGGLQWSSEETSIRQYLPRDPDHQLVVSFHTYNFSGCSNVSCWDATIRPLAKVMPVVTGEFGEDDCSTPFSNSYMAFADSAGISYLGWTWDAISPGGWSCKGGPSLINSYDGTPSGEGVALHTHLASLSSDERLPAQW